MIANFVLFILFMFCGVMFLFQFRQIGTPFWKLTQPQIVGLLISTLALFCYTHALWCTYESTQLLLRIGAEVVVLLGFGVMIFEPRRLVWFKSLDQFQCFGALIFSVGVFSGLIV